eukprot:CAMPEP_0119407686 /NCGR_PEP_ID=MMETSP1335-20130426/1487_1 /TAXON_ID=259385 /ORGANISM="Chrysoculter rhomboideus, Strain RCC1486" /LENGTH=39 /DNA_ID= /DNA_START= /DNA_END= /DNA_ORIENTATION=
MRSSAEGAARFIGDAAGIAWLETGVWELETTWKLLRNAQ